MKKSKRKKSKRKKTKKVGKKVKSSRKSAKKTLIKKTLAKAKKLIQADNLNNELLARQQLWTVTVLEIILFRKQFPSFLVSNEDEFESPWKIKIENECKKLRGNIKRAIKCGDLEIVEQEIDFRVGNYDEPLMGILEGKNEQTPMDFYFLFSHKEPGYKATQLLKVLHDLGYPVPHGLIKAIEEKRFQDIGKLIWGLHQNMICWLRSDKKLPTDLFPCPLEETLSHEPSPAPSPAPAPAPAIFLDPILVKREARKLNTKAMYESWRIAYANLKKENPNKSDTSCAVQISKMPIGKKHSPETIRKNMKK